MEKDKLDAFNKSRLKYKEALDELAKGRKDPKGKAKPTQTHRDKTKYKRKPKHVRDTTDK